MLSISALPNAPAFVDSNLAAKYNLGDASGRSAFYQHPMFRLIRIFFQLTMKKDVPPHSFVRR
jgi:hypothetical protein